MSNKQYKIETLKDILGLTKEQRERFVVDLLVWCDFYDGFDNGGILKIQEEMIWVDDERTGEISGYTVLCPVTGYALYKEEV